MLTGIWTLNEGTMTALESGLCVMDANCQPIKSIEMAEFREGVPRARVQKTADPWLAMRQARSPDSLIERRRLAESAGLARSRAIEPVRGLATVAHPRKLEEIPKGLREITVGDRRYPLRSALSEERLSSLRSVLGLNANASTLFIQRTLHFKFQRLYHCPPHERTNADSETWLRLLEIVNLSEYERINPWVQSRTGYLVRCDSHHVVIRWLGEDSDEVYDFLDFPSAAAAARVPCHITAEYRVLPTGRVVWMSVQVAQPPSEGEPEPKPESLETSPFGDWPTID